MPVASSATTPAAKCAATKIKATGKLAGARLQCQGKAIKRGAPFDQPCEQKAEDKFTLTFEKAEARGGCVTIGDGGTISGKLDAFFTDVMNELDQNDTTVTEACIGTKVVATGRKARDKLNCHAKAVHKGAAVDPGCLAKAENKFGTQFSGAEAGDSCGTTGDASALEAKVDAFVDDVIAEEPSQPTTTTTTTTSTSTTTTTMPLASC